MLEIGVTDGGRVALVTLQTIQTVTELRLIEDLWPEYTELFSSRPGDYDLLLSHGVPARMCATLIKFRGYAFRSAVMLLSESYYQQKNRVPPQPNRALERTTSAD